MKKKILILVMCVCMLVPMFALASFADTAEALATQWSYQWGLAEGVLYHVGSGGSDSGTTNLQIGGGIANARVYMYFNSADKTYEFDSIHWDYDYLYLSVGSDDVDRVSVQAASSAGTSAFAVQYNANNFVVEENGVEIVNWDVSENPVNYKVLLLYNDSAIMNGYVEQFFPDSLDPDDSLFSHIGQFSELTISKGNNFVVDNPKNLVDLMFSSVAATGIGLAGGIKSAVSNLIWKDPLAQTKELSTFAIFIFTIAGLAIAMTVFWLIFRLIRFGRQR